MNDIMQLAQQLGKAIAASPAAQSMHQARLQVQNDAAAAELLHQFQSQAEKIARLEEENRPIEVEDKRRLHALEDRIAGNDKVKALTEAEMDYMDLIRRVNTAIQHELQAAQQ